MDSMQLILMSGWPLLLYRCALRRCALTRDTYLCMHAWTQSILKVSISENFPDQDAGHCSCEPWGADTVPQCAACTGPDQGRYLQPGEQHLGYQLCHVAALYTARRHYEIPI